MDINCNKLTITVNNQNDLEKISSDFEGTIYIDFGTTTNPAIVQNRYFRSVVARGNSSVVARGNSSVVARENSSVVAGENSSVVAWENSSVVAWENSSVVAWENSSVEARENSSVVARGNSSVVARGNSSVEARENSSVVAWENSLIKGFGNAQIVKRMSSAQIEISGNARIVYMPKTIEEYCGFYNIEHDEHTGKFFKCVHKRNGKYVSDHTWDFEYVIGERVIPDCFDNDIANDCGHGIHVAHMDWVLNYGKGWRDLSIIEVEAKLEDIVIPEHSSGKIRCKEVTVIREVPLEECGLFGKILAKRRTDLNR